jgi:hypothetical protein
MGELDDAFGELYLQDRLPHQLWLFDPLTLSISSRVLLAWGRLPISQGQRGFFLILQLLPGPPVIFLYFIKKAGILFWGIISFLLAHLSIEHFTVFTPSDQPLTRNFLARFYSTFISLTLIPDPILHYGYASLILLFRAIICSEWAHFLILLSPNFSYCFSWCVIALRKLLCICSLAT